MNKYHKTNDSGAVEIVVIADRSGSMESIRKDAIGGFNTFLKDQQAQEGKANLTLVLFDTEYEVPVRSVPVKDVYPLTYDTFVPRGGTAMYDAIGRALNELDAKNPEHAIIVILTDGEENASREFQAHQIKSKITAAENKGWQVQYLAANQDAFKSGARIGVLHTNTANFVASGAGVRDAYATVSMNTTSYRSQSDNSADDLMKVYKPETSHD